MESESFDIKTLLSNNNFTKQENEILQSIDNSLQEHGVFIKYKYDDSLDCAKYRPSEKLIKLKKSDSFPTLLHELLHAKITTIDKIPDFDEIEDLKNGRNLIFFKKLIVDITNDLHHHIFFNEFRKLTGNYDVECFIVNAKDYKSLENYKYINYYSKDQKNAREKSDSLIKSYCRNFIPLRYNSLLYKGDLSLYKENSNDAQMGLFCKLFDQVISANKDNRKIKDAYSDFFDDLITLTL